jgi:hypothetical protein
MEEFVARENIRRFETQLADCRDTKQQKTLEELLETERKRLAEAQSMKRGPAKA